MPPVENTLIPARCEMYEVVATVAPGFGAATVERIAINAVMAGCRADYLPVLLAATQAMSAKAFNLQGIQATTNPVAVWMVINGPIAEQLGDKFDSIADNYLSGQDGKGENFMRMW